MSNFKPVRVKKKKYRQWVATLPCLICGEPNRTQNAHIKNGCGSASASDDQIVPLCAASPSEIGCHMKQHAAGSERKWWSQYGGIEKALRFAKDLFGIWVRGADRYEAMDLIREFRL